MYDSVSPSSPSSTGGGIISAAVRSDSAIRSTFVAQDGSTSVDGLYQRGALRLKFPRTGRCEGVIVNTGGGVTGGDVLSVSIKLGASSRATITSQAAEKIYRTDGPPAKLAVAVEVGTGAALTWLPQETILYDGSSMERSLSADLAEDARLTMLEMVAFGRLESGEIISACRWRDAWSIRRAGRLVFADRVRLEGSVDAELQRVAVAGGARATATLVHVASDAEGRLRDVRDAIAGVTAQCVASAWNGIIVARMLGASVQELRQAAGAIVERLTGEAMPRAWSC